MKQHSVLIIALFVATAFCVGCKESKPQEKTGIVTLKVGSVKIQRDGGQTVEAKISEQVRQGDTIVTAKNSTMVVQFSDSFVVQIEESSIMRVTSSMEDNREMFVEDGQVLAKLVKTGKNNASISTPTSVAAVRGTQFSVSYREGKSQVAVAEGKVAVKAVRAEDAGKPAVEPAGETLTEAGKTAEIVSTPGKAGAPLELNVRPISDTEKKELKKIESVPVIPEAEKKDAATIETTVKEAIGQAQEKEEGSRQEKVKALMEKKTRSMEEIRQVFNRIDEITLYNGRVIQGAVMTRGEVYTILTPGGTITIPEKQIKGSRILK
jgi:hypothetical protein